MSKRIVAANIKLKRAYDSAGSGDGTRILIRPSVAPWSQENKCRDRSVGQGHCTQHRAAEVVRT
jgi:hypothetical protein